MPLNRSPADMTSTEVLFENLTMKTSKFGVTIRSKTRPPHITNFISFEVHFRRLSKCYWTHYKCEPWHITNDQCHRHGGNDWRSEWRMSWHDKLWFHTHTYLTMNGCWSISHNDWMWVTLRPGSDIWSLIKCGFLSSSCISQWVILEIMYRPRDTNVANWEGKTLVGRLGKISGKCSIDNNICMPSIVANHLLMMMTTTMMMDDGWWW